MARFVPNPGFPPRLKRSPEMRSMLRSRAARAAREATRIGKSFADSYEATVEDDDEGVRIEGNTGGINAASWWEFGTQNNPAVAPLRKGAEAAGLKTTGRR